MSVDDWLKLAFGVPFFHSSARAGSDGGQSKAGSAQTGTSLSGVPQGKPAVAPGPSLSPPQDGTGGDAQSSDHTKSSRAKYSAAPLSPPTYCGGALPADIEAVARAICIARDLNPDTLHQHYEGETDPRNMGQPWPTDALLTSRNFLAHYGWRHHISVAHAAIAARPDSGMVPVPRGLLQRVQNALSFAQSALRCGEPWTEICRKDIHEPAVELRALLHRAGETSGS